MKPSINIQPFGKVNNEEVHLITLQNQNTTTFQCITYGAIWHSLTLKDKNEKNIDVVVAPKNIKGYIDQYLSTPYFFGACIGRYAGRISNSKISVNGKKYNLEKEGGNVPLHSGEQGLGKKLWSIESSQEGLNPSITLSCTSNHLSGGYPGNLKVNVRYCLKEDDTIELIFDAISDSDTILNLTNHTYFNLGGTSILNDYLKLNANHILELNSEKIPTGQLLETSNTPFDFQHNDLLEKISSINGLDDVFVLKKAKKIEQVQFFSEDTGIKMSINTNQPSVVIFTPKSIDFQGIPKNIESGKTTYPAICFETQNYPDAPNHASFPTSLLRKGERYKSKTTYAFKILKNDEKED